MHSAARPLESILAAAVEISSEAERRQFVEQACGGDAELQRRVEELIENHFRAGNFLERPAATVATVRELALSERPGTEIGLYKLLEVIGEGGFGVVFMAEQQQPLRRKVALKVLKPGMDSAQVIARFEQERQALALMDHPHIAKVHDAGQTSSGRPFFVMELVKGLPITDFCDQTQLTSRERLELFVHVCQAVQHAHQKGIIHRDLKPGNVLVTLQDGNPLVKVIDFGIAKALGQQLTDKTLFTGFAQMIGTPLYMPPEQAALSNVDVDTRSDIYSLGVLLYELLTGTTPFDKERLRQAGFDEMRRIICEEEPPRPSTRMSTVGQAATLASEKRRSDPRKLSRLFRGELDWIVMKALEKDRNRRYESASAFAADVERYLNDEPVQACPPSLGYRLQKFVRRNKGPVLAAGVFLFLLVAGIAGTTTGLIRALNAERQAVKDRDAKDEARRQAVATAEAEKEGRRRERQAINTMTDAMMADLLGRQVRLTDQHREFLKKVLAQHEAFAAAAADNVESQQNRAEGYFRVGHIRERLGELKEAESAYREAVAIHQQLAARFPKQPEFRQGWAISQNNRALVLLSLGRLPEAEKAFDETLALRKQLADQNPKQPNDRYLLATTYRNLGGLLRDTGRLPEAEKAYGAAQTISERLAASFPDRADFREECSIVQGHLCVAFAIWGRLREAEKACRAALAIRERLARDFPDRPDFRHGCALAYHNLGNLLRDTGRLPEAEEVFRAALTRLKQLASDFPNRPEFRQELAMSHNNLGNLLGLRKQPKEAEEVLRDALALSRRLVADFPDRPDFGDALATSYGSLASLLLATDRQEEAEKAFQATLALREQLAKECPERPAFRRMHALAYFNLGGAVFAARGPQQAEEALRKALAISQKLVQEFPTVPEYQDDLAHTFLKLGLLHVLRQEVAPAVALLTQAVPHHQAAVKGNPGNRSYREHYRTTLTQLAQGYFRLADHARLAKVADDLGGVGCDAAKDVYDAANFLGLCVVLNAQDAKLDQAKREQLARNYVSRLRELLRQGVALGNKDAPQMYKTWRDTLKQMAKAHLDLAEHGWLAVNADDLAWWGYDPPNDTYDAACFLCHAARLAGKDARLDEPKRKELGQRYADRALAMLRQAVAGGYKDAARMRQNPDLEPLRTREDFRQLLAEVEGKTKE